MKILLVSNPSHIGIKAVADSYCRAFQRLGLDFDYLAYQDEPRITVEQAGMVMLNKVIMNDYSHVIIVQPTFFTINVFNRLNKIKKDQGIKFYAINTDDPYSTSVILQIRELFDIVFTNELLVANMCKNLNFIYLPLAFDTLFPFKKHEAKKYDIAYIATFYKNRMEYVNSFKDIAYSKFIAGNIAPLYDTDTTIDMTAFSSIIPRLFPRHQELEIYSQSHFVFNPHRDPLDTGYDFLYVSKGIKCRPVITSAISPNPRMFDSIGCGSIPIYDFKRSQCCKLMKDYALYDIGSFINGEEINNKYFEKIFNNYNKFPDQYWNASFFSFIENENYINRTQFIMERIS